MCAGFTLMEVMVAVSLLAIVLVAVYRLHTQSISMNQSIQFYTMAPLLAQAKMSELERTPADDLNTDSGDFGDDVEGYSWEVVVEDVDSEPLGDVSERFKRIDLTVSFNDGVFGYGIRNYVLTRKKD